MHDTPKIGRPPVLSLWTDGSGGCLVVLSHAGPGVPFRPDFDKLAFALTCRELRLQGISRTHGAHEPAGLREIGQAPWHGGDLMEEVTRLLDAVPAADRPAQVAPAPPAAPKVRAPVHHEDATIT